MDGLAHIEDASPWHEGELALQREAGVAERMAIAGPRAIRDHLIEQHRLFYPQLPFIVAGVVDPRGDAWATLIAGKPGFLDTPDAMTLTVRAARDPDDPADAGLDDGGGVGLLGIELRTRRRNRLNGTLRRADASGFSVDVRESFGNCPKYIRLRNDRFVRDPAERPAVRPELLPALDGRAWAMIEAAETLFIASSVERGDGRRHVDVSHRGGKPGFVRADVDGLLTVPDFAGNRYFNTLGNIRANPRAGITFVDFENGDLLQLSGEGEVVIDDPEIAAFQGAERLLRFRPRRIVRRADTLPLRWTAPENGVSPFTTATGTWAEVHDAS